MGDGPQFTFAADDDPATDDRFFFGACGLVTFLLVGFVPRFSLAPGLAVAATLAFSGVVAALYLALSPGARGTWPGLLVVLAVVDTAALAAVHLSGAAGLGLGGLVAVLVATTAVVGIGALWLARRLPPVRRAR